MRQVCQRLTTYSALLLIKNMALSGIFSNQTTSVMSLRRGGNGDQESHKGVGSPQGES